MKADPATKEATRFVSEHLEMLDRITERLLAKMPKYRVIRRRNWLTGQQEYVPQIISYLGEYDGDATYGYKAIEDHDGKPVAFTTNESALAAIGFHKRGDAYKTEVVFESVQRAREPSVFEAADTKSMPRKKMPKKR